MAFRLGGGQHLHGPEVGDADHADVAVAPRLRGDPLDEVVRVLPQRHAPGVVVADHLAARVARAAQVADDVDVVLRDDAGDVAGLGAAVPHRTGAALGWGGQGERLELLFPCRCGACRATDEALLGGGPARGVGGGGHEARGSPPLEARDDHALGDLPGEQVGELLGGPGRRRVGLRRQEVAAEQLLGPHTRGGDQVYPGRAGQRLVQPHVAAVEHARAVDDGPAAVRAELPQLPRQGSEDLRAVHRDVERVLGARNHGQQCLVDRDNTQVVRRDGAEHGVDGVVPGSLWCARHGTSFRQRRAGAAAHAASTKEGSAPGSLTSAGRAVVHCRVNLVNPAC